MSRPTLWISSVGHVNVRYPSEWDDFIMPKQLNIISVDYKENTNRYTSYEHFVSFKLDTIDTSFDYMVNAAGNLLLRYHYNFGFKKEDVIKPWIDTIKSRMIDPWTPVLADEARIVLKKYLIENEFEYFSEKYPEILI